MEMIWDMVESFKLKKNIKNVIFIFVMVLVYGLLGGLVWFLFGQKLFPGIDCVVCFIGYPAMFAGFLGGLVFLFNHEFS